MGKTVVLGMSGGVDSSASAVLLAEQGYSVIGVTLDLIPEEGGQVAAGDPHSFAAPDHEAAHPSERSAAKTAAEDAARVCSVLGIRHEVVENRQCFRREVIDRFAEDYRSGRTPNPCVVCNRHVKWATLIEAADRLGADYVATGHYAGIVKRPNGRLSIRSSDSGGKDQSYALYNLTQQQLARTIFPLDGHIKPEVREIAKQANLPVAQKPDSQEICFVPDGDYAAYIERCTGCADVPGNFVDDKGTILGTHRGITRYTIGQRKGLGLAMGRPVFVTAIRPERNEVVIGESEDLFKSEFRADAVNMMGLEKLTSPLQVFAKIRYNQNPVSATIEPDPEQEGAILCRFTEPQRAVTPGQAAVFYENGCILCGGTIVI